METKTVTIIISILQFIILEITSFFIQKSLTIDTDKIMIKELIDNAIIIGTIISIVFACILWIRWKYLDKINDMDNKIKMLKTWIDKSYVIHKYYDIMLIKAQDSNQANANWVYQDDFNYFSENEKKYLHSYLKDIESLRIDIRGTNNPVFQKI